MRYEHLLTSEQTSSPWTTLGCLGTLRTVLHLNGKFDIRKWKISLQWNVLIFICRKVNLYVCFNYYTSHCPCLVISKNQDNLPPLVIMRVFPEMDSVSTCIIHLFMFTCFVYIYHITLVTMDTCNLSLRQVTTEPSSSLSYNWCLSFYRLISSRLIPELIQKNLSTRCCISHWAVSDDVVNFSYAKKMGSLPVADPGFPRGGGAISRGRNGRQHRILPIFPKNCMKLKEFGPRRGRASLVPPGSATELTHFSDAHHR